MVWEDGGGDSASYPINYLQAAIAAIVSITGCKGPGRELFY